MTTGCPADADLRLRHPLSYDHCRRSVISFYADMVFMTQKSVPKNRYAQCLSKSRLAVAQPINKRPSVISHRVPCNFKKPPSRLAANKTKLYLARWVSSLLLHAPFVRFRNGKCGFVREVCNPFPESESLFRSVGFIITVLVRTRQETFSVI